MAGTLSEKRTCSTVRLTMAELEIHHESEHPIDPMGQKVGVLAALLAVFLALVTIASIARTPRRSC